MCKTIISPGVFFNVKILIFQVIKLLKGKKWPKMSKISVCCTLYFRNHISHDLHLLCLCMYKRVISPGIFLIFFFKILIFGIIREVRVGVVKGQEMAYNDKKFCQSHSLSHEPYIIYCNFWYTCVK